MNFLGHFYLSGDNEGLIIGNFIADFVKGRSYLDYPAHIAEGIRMHREIDAFTDSHATFRLSKSRLWDKYRHYAAVIVDMYYDHYLAANFNQYHPKNLSQFTRETYELLERNVSDLPGISKSLLHNMKKYDWLFNYRYLEGIDRSLIGMSKRTRFRSNLEQAIHELKTHYNIFEQDFKSFFPDAIKTFKPA